MSRPVLVMLSLLSCLLGPVAWSAEISVPPGEGTLAAAVAGASAGDTLVLQQGIYSGEATVDKSLTLRPTNKTTFALIAGALSISGDGIQVTVQGLTFSQDLNLDAAAAVRVLENTFNAGSIIARGPIGSGSTEADAPPALVIVGNRLAAGYIDHYDQPGLGAGPFYIAGNTLASGSIDVHTSASIVGNEIRATNVNGIVASGGWLRILANRVHHSDTAHSDTAGVTASAPYLLIAGNAIELEDSFGGGYWQYGIRASGTGYATIVNNLIRGVPEDSYRLGYGIDSSSPITRISGNIILDFIGSSVTPIYAHGASNDVSHNLCYHNSGDCPAGNGNLNGVDPKFVDLVEYRLAADSPAIDAGPADNEFADLDRTRNDMGAWGGPWSIGQYDAQRAPGTLAPYVYPLTAAGWFPPGSGNNGTLEVKSLGVARLR